MLGGVGWLTRVERSGQIMGMRACLKPEVWSVGLCTVSNLRGRRKMITCI